MRVLKVLDGSGDVIAVLTQAELDVFDARPPVEGQEYTPKIAQVVAAAKQAVRDLVAAGAGGAAPAKLPG